MSTNEGDISTEVAAQIPQGGLASRIYADVKVRILLGQARPGDVIAAHSLARDLAVSRTPVHEALKRLVGEGYLITRPRLGYVVTPVSLDEMRDLFQVRTRLEALAAELAAPRWTSEDHRAFSDADHAIQRHHRELSRTGTSLELVQFMHDAHKQFHLMIADIGGNRRLGRLIAELQDETQRYWALLPSDRLISKVFLTDEAHRAILDAIASKDPALARKAMTDHMREGVGLMLKAVVPENPPSDDLGA